MKTNHLIATAFAAILVASAAPAFASNTFIIPDLAWPTAPKAPEVHQVTDAEVADPSTTKPVRKAHCEVFTKVPHHQSLCVKLSN